MKTQVTVLLLTVALGANHWAHSAPKSGDVVLVEERNDMTRVSLGEHAKMTVFLAERERLQKFYRDVLGCKVITKGKAADLIQLGPNFYIGVVYDDAALTDSDGRKATWLEIRAADPEGLKQKILDFGIKGIDYWDKEHFYFQAPGGQVFRLVGKTEDMSKWQQ